VTRIGLRLALLASAALQAAGMFAFALWPTPAPLLIATGLGGAAAVLFQVSAPPFMMQHSDADERDHLFSANAAVNIGLSGVGSLVAGGLPALFGRLLGIGAESGLAYRATFAVAGVGLALSLVPLLLIPKREPTTDHRPPTTDQEPRTENREPAEDGGSRIEDGNADTSEKPSSTLESRSSTSRFTFHASRFTFHASRFTFRALLERVPEPWRGMIRRPGPLLRLLIPPALISGGAALLIPYLNLFFKQRFDVSDALLGLIFAGQGIVVGLAALAGPLISARIGKIRTVALTQALSIPFLLALGFAPFLAAAAGAALVRAALFNMGSPLYDAFAMERTEESARPTVIGLINGAYSIGYLAAPLISTWVQERYGFAPLFATTAICYVLAVAANYWFFVRDEATCRRSS
jgi:MFS family permease